MLALRHSLRQTLARPAAAVTAARPYSNGKIQEEIKEDKEGWTENREVSGGPPPCVCVSAGREVVRSGREVVRSGREAVGSGREVVRRSGPERGDQCRPPVLPPCRPAALPPSWPPAVGHRVPGTEHRGEASAHADTQDTESEAVVTADRSDAPAKPNEKLVQETIDKIDGKHHGGKGELKVSGARAGERSERGGRARTPSRCAESRAQVTALTDPQGKK